MNLHFDVSALLKTLPLLLKGMLGVFAVILAIWLFVALLNRLTAGKK